MKIIKCSKIWFVALLTIFSCISEFPIELSFSEPQLVINAYISSNPDDSFIYLGWTFPVGEGCYDPYGNPIACPPDVIGTGPYLVNGTVLIKEELGQSYSYNIQMYDRRNHIIIPMTDITGVLGRKYDLTIDIEYNNVTSRYTAHTRMLDTPTIDHTDYEIRQSDIVGKDDVFVPLISFKEPQNEKNFYLFRLCRVSGRTAYCRSSRVWGCSVMSDEFLREEVIGLSIDDGATIARYTDFYPQVSPGQGAEVKMYSVNKETYEFYKSLLHQFENDGGTFSPTPSLFHGNVTGGAIGIFWAADESSGRVTL
jgi:hypothetical protein